MKLLSCPRCREVDTDNEDHPTGIRLCNACQNELGARIIAERSGANIPPNDLDAMRQAYVDALRDVYHAEIINEEMTELYKGWKGDY